MTISPNDTVQFSMVEYNTLYRTFQNQCSARGVLMKTSEFNDWVRDFNITPGHTEKTMELHYSNGETTLWESAKACQRRRGIRAPQFEDDGSEENI